MRRSCLSARSCQRISPVSAAMRSSTTAATEFPEGIAPSYSSLGRAISLSASCAAIKYPPLVLSSNDRKTLLYRHFLLFLTLSAQNHILFGAFISVVSVCSGCRCGINCGQKTTSQSLNFLNTGGCFFFLYQKLIRSRQRRNVFSSQPVRRQQAKHGSNFAKCRNTQNSRKCILTCDIGYIEVKVEM